MDREGALLLILGIGALALGPLLYHWARRIPRGQLVLSVGIALTVGALVAFEIIPDCVRSAGWLALVFAAIGLAAPLLMDRAPSATPVRGLPLGLAFAAVVLHAMADGMALSSGAHGHEHGAIGGLALAVLIHRVPEGAALWYVLAPAGRRVAVSGIAFDGVFSTVGFVLGDAALPLVGSTAVALAQAFLAGVLLHVLLHRPDHEHAVARAE